MNRRGFLGTMVGTVLGGKQAVTKAAMNGGMNGLSAVLGRDIFGGERAPHIGTGVPFQDQDDESKSVGVDALRIIGVPDWLKHGWKDEAREIRLLDPDIAACQSWSLSAKIAMQRQRNYKKNEDGFWERGARQQAQSVWTKTFGYLGWW